MDAGRVKSTSGLNLRLKPNGEKLAVLGHNEQVDILEEVVFYRVKTASGQLGYVHGSYIEKQPEDVLESEENVSERFQQLVFSDETFIGEAIKIDKDFAPALKRTAEYAKKAGLKVWVTSSVRPMHNQVQGAIVTPATRSCHHIGHAIDMNLMVAGKLYNSKKLKRSNIANLPNEIQQFIADIRADEHLRWGGDFNTEDPVHIDDDYFRKHQLLYLSKLSDRVARLNAIA